MHIAFLTTEYPHPQIAGRTGGIGTSIKYLANKLAENNKVTVFIISQKENKFFKDGDVNIYTIKQKKIPRFTWLANAIYANNLINKIIISEKIDLIEIPDWGGIGAFMRFKIPRITRLHGTDTYFSYLENEDVKRKNFFLEKRNLQMSSSIVGVSKFVSEKTKELFKINKQIAIIHNGIDTDLFSPSITSFHPNSILYFGTFIRKKGFLELADIFNKIVEVKGDARLYLAGKDSIDNKEKISSYKLFYNRLSSSARLNIVNLGMLQTHQLLDIIDKTQIVVFPSYAEAFPMSWLEAMAMEKPLVTSNIGWANEMIINGKTGLMEYPANHAAFAEKILYLLDHSDFARKIGKNARESVLRKFSSDVIANQNIKFYTNIIKQHKKKR